MRSPRGPRHAAPGRRPWRRPATAVALVLALLGGLTLSAKALDRAGPPTSAPARAGAGSRAATTAAQQAADGRLEAAIGRKLSIGHSFVPWGAALGDLPAANLAAGRTPMISFGRGASSRAVAAGRHDAYLRSLARSVAGLGQPVLLRYAWDMDGWARRAARPRPVRRPGRPGLLGLVAHR